MPCNCDHLKATDREREASRVLCLLDELDGKQWNQNSWEGYHPSIYNKSFSVDVLTSELCARLQKEDVSKYSLELQIWWRDHQKVDKERVERELQARKDAKDKKSAIAKLTPYERKLLGL